MGARTTLFHDAAEHAPYLGVEAAEGRFVIATDDRGVDAGLFVKRARPEFRVLTRAVALLDVVIGQGTTAGRAFVDVGASIGTSTIAALTAHRFESAVACEPHEDAYRLLRANLALNGLSDRVQTLRAAVSNRPGRSRMVVPELRRSASWVAVDERKIHAAEALLRASMSDEAGPAPVPESPVAIDGIGLTVVEVDLVTLDGLVEAEIVEPELVGMLWVVAEGHEGHVLGGGASLTGLGVPVLLRFHPEALDERGDRDGAQSAAQEHYTHFVDTRPSERDRTQGRFQLRPVGELPGYAERFLDPAARAFYTDLLLLRLTPEQARVV